MVKIKVPNLSNFKAFWKECRDLKDIVRKFAILKQQNPADINTRKQHSEALKEYKKICNTKKATFEENQIRQLDELANDPTQFWKKWKYYGDSYRNNNPLKVDGKKWETYFARLYQNNNTSVTLPDPTQNAREEDP